MVLLASTHRVVANAKGTILLRVGEAAELLSVSRWTIYRWLEEGRLRGTKIGKGSVRIFRDSVMSLIETCQIDHADSFQNSKHS